MALPNQLKSARMTNATLGSSIDDEVGNAEKAICDIVGVPVDTNISAALLEVVAAGLKSVIFQDGAADPTTAGYLRRNAKELLFHNGERAYALKPTGVVEAFAGAAAPTGAVLCDGAAISRATFARLFALIGTTYGVGDGSTTFNVPDCRGRSIFGKAAAGTFAALGNTGGAETLPNHVHTQQGTVGTSTSLNNDFADGSAGQYATSAHTHNVTLSGNTSNPTTNPSILAPYIT